MGNQPSAVEARGHHHHAPNKLSKPRTGSHSSSNGLLTNRLSHLSAHSHASQASHKTSLPSPAPNKQREPLSSPVQPDAHLPHLPPIPGRSLTTAAAPTRHRQNDINNQADWDYSYDDSKDNLPTLGRRRSLFRSKSVVDPERRQEKSHHKRSNSGGVQRRNSVANEQGANYYGEAITENWAVHPNQQRKSINYDLMSYESQRLLNTSEQRQTFVEEGPAMPETHDVSESTWKSSNPHPASAAPSVKNGEFGHASRASSDLSMYTTPMRRLSLRQPGIATRSKTEGPSRRHSRTTTPERSRRPSFMIGDDEDEMHLPLPPTIVYPGQPRVLTPCEDDYKQIGAFKLGSLRIVNGAASPSPMGSPSEKKVAKINGDDTPTKKQKIDGYFARKLGKTASKFLSPKPEADEEDAEEPGELQPTYLKEMPQIHSPIPSGPLVSPFATSISNLDSSVSSESSKPGTLSSPNLSKGTQDAKDISKNTSSRLELPSDYLPALKFNLTNSERPSKEELRTTSKHTAQEDQLFEDDQASDILSTGAEVLDVRNDPSAKPDPANPVSQRPKLDPTQRGSRTISRSDSGFVSSPTSDGASTHRSSGTSAVSSRLTKADSGYSSNVSLRSFQGNSKHNSLAAKALVPDKDFPPKRHPSSIASKRARSSFLVENVKEPNLDRSTEKLELEKKRPPSIPDREPSPPAVPDKDFPPLSPGNTSLNSSRFSLGPNQALQSTRQSRFSNSLRKSRLFMTPSPMPSQTASEPPMRRAGPTKSPLSPLSLVSGRSSAATSPSLPTEKPTKSGRLRRLLSGSGLQSQTSKSNLGLHQNHHLDSARIPNVPKHTENSLADHETKYPSASQRLALKTRESKETLMTILSITTSGSATPGGERQRSDRDRNFKKTKESLSIPERRNTMSGDVSEDQPGARRRMGRHEAPPLIHRNTVDGAAFPHFQLPQIHTAASYNNLDTMYATDGFDPDGYFAQEEKPRQVAASVGRTFNVASEAERSIYKRVAVQRQAEKEARASSSQASNMAGYLDPLSPVSAAPSPTTAHHRARAISRSGSLRVPPPLRPQSIPPTQNQTEALSRKSSREAIQSFPSSTPNSDDTGFVAPLRPENRKSTQSSSEAPPIPPQNPRRSTSSSRANSLSSDTGGPDWQPIVARRESMSSYSNVGGYATPPPPSRPASAAGYQTTNLQAPPSLHHRNSYDRPMVAAGPGYFEAQTRQLAAELGAGRHTIYSSGSIDTWSTGHVSYGPSPFPWDQYGHGSSLQGGHAPYVPRQKRRSSHVRPPNVPYRVLHSYNSPAYKGVPIWSRLLTTGPHRDIFILSSTI
ncbi:hypothetical protein MKZ38_009269 [Zalerion maritima]|uniref:Uncharacterized protein n=1 Tax=Zalerion maritima TaxID=339359 RepID=A0AAD5RH79_9PEZI|nr:hypothetical protein MKZ38_009269 [Zalerion maritima]